MDAAAAYAVKSANYTALATDDNTFIRFDTAATLSLTAAATLGSGWNCTVIADGVDVIVDPNSTEQINGETTITIPEGFTATIICDGSGFRTTSINSVLSTFVANGPQVWAGHLNGYTLSNNGSDATNDIDIAAGTCMDSTAAYFMRRASSITKRLDAAWAAGTDQGGLDTGSFSDGTYHCYVIMRPDTGVVDIVFSASASAPTLPDDYTVYRRIGSIIRVAGSIVAFSQIGDEFLLDLTALDIDVSNQSTTAILRTLTVPVGIQVWAKIRARANNASAWSVILSSPDVADRAPSASAAPLHDLGGAGGTGDRATLEIRTNTSAQIRSRASIASTELTIATYGWIDTRGK